MTVRPKLLNKFIKKITKSNLSSITPIEKFKKNGYFPWTQGYNEYKWEVIYNSIHNNLILKKFEKNAVNDFAFRVDERAVEYLWLFSRLTNKKEKILDAGSVLNFHQLLELEILENKDLSILTYFPEENAFFKKRISYIYSDLRDVPFRDLYFDTVVCLSTLEHINMDNSMYGYSSESNIKQERDYNFLEAVNELIRITKLGGDIFISVPFGCFENHGFFQQFDHEMIEKLNNQLIKYGQSEITYYRYDRNGWMNSNLSECLKLRSYNPHTGKNKADDFAAHARSVACIHFRKKQ